MKTRLLTTLFLSLLVAAVLPAFPHTAVLQTIELRENLEVRMRIIDVLTGPVRQLKEFRENVYVQKNYEHRVRVQVRSRDNHVYTYISNELHYRFPAYSAGSMVLKRHEQSGDFVSLKIYVNGHEDCYATIRAAGDRSRVDLSLFGELVASSIHLPFPWQHVLQVPLSMIIEATTPVIPWQYAFPRLDSYSYSLVQNTAEEIRRSLPYLNDSDDGAMDENGNFVFIETLGLNPAKGLNCSGFVKFVADGLAAQQLGRYFTVEELKEKHPEARGNRWSLPLDDERDPYFGLDWTRNIAVKLMPDGEDIESADVRRIRDFERIAYVEDVGFPVESLPFVLHQLAVAAPGDFYLGSIVRDFGSDPVLRQHVHVLVLLPYFDSDGNFEVNVFERNYESSLASLQRRYSYDYIHLVRVRSVEGFSLPDLE